jgi:hypothetical protein
MAGVFTDAFDVSTALEQPVHVCQLFCEVVYEACDGETLAVGAHAGEIVGHTVSATDFCETELHLGSNRDGIFSNDCFSAASALSASPLLNSLFVLLALGASLVRS